MNFDPDAPYQGPKFFGKYKGYVRDVSDPDRRGRLRAYCPQVGGEVDDEKHWLPWAEPVLTWLGGVNSLNLGSPPTLQQQGGTDKIGVWIEFEMGHPDFPIWNGTFTVAPKSDDPQAQIDLTVVTGLVGSSIIESPPNGTDLAALNPPKPIDGDEETRLIVRRGRDIIIMSDHGGSIIIGPSGVQITGIQVTINGVLYNAAAADANIR